MKITIYYQNRIDKSWNGFQLNDNGSITITDPSALSLTDNAVRFNKDQLNSTWSWCGFIEIKGDIKKGIWFPLEHENGSASQLSSSTFVLWD